MKRKERIKNFASEIVDSALLMLSAMAIFLVCCYERARSIFLPRTDEKYAIAILTRIRYTIIYLSVAMLFSAIKGKKKSKIKPQED